MRPQREVAQCWTVLAAISIAGYRLVGMCYSASYPNISAEAIAAQFSSAIPADVRLYSVGQYRHSLAFYLRRTPAIYDYVGEFEFGMHHSSLTPAEHDRAHFLRDWRQDTSAVAFIDTREYPALAAAGIPGYVLANDGRSIVLSRQPSLDGHVVTPRNRDTKE
jgi:hypothetical protein